MGSVVKGMDKVLGSMNIEAISKVRFYKIEYIDIDIIYRYRLIWIDIDRYM